ncbi:FecCD family ABC transporter permease [Thalassiella azotivora]
MSTGRSAATSAPSPAPGPSSGPGTSSGPWTSQPPGAVSGPALPALPAGPSVRRRRLLALVVLGLLVLLVVVASLAVGARGLTPAQVWTGLWADAGTEEAVVVRSLRLPRTLVALVVGAALGVAGGLMQGHTRNPLADPGILGVSAGAALAVVLAIYLLGASSPLTYVWFAFGGAALAAVVVYLVGSAGGSGPATPVTLALAGTALTALLTALTTAVVVSDATTLDGYRFWAVGSVAGRGLDVLVPLLPFFAAGMVLAALNAPGLNLLGMGEDVARALGQDVARTRLVGIAAVTLLVGAAVSSCGPLGFVGLVVPHVARALTGPDHRWLLPTAGLAGAVLVVAADVVGRVLVRPGELQVGVVLALVGAPFFIALVRRRRMVRL